MSQVHLYPEDPLWPRVSEVTPFNGGDGVPKRKEPRGGHVPKLPSQTEGQEQGTEFKVGVPDLFFPTIHGLLHRGCADPAYRCPRDNHEIGPTVPANATNKV